MMELFVMMDRVLLGSDHWKREHVAFVFIINNHVEKPEFVPK